MMSNTATAIPVAEKPADNILNAAEELRAAASAKAAEIRAAFTSGDLKTVTDRVVRETSQRWREVSDNTAAFIRENPGKAALAALGVGFAIGVLFRRD